MTVVDEPGALDRLVVFEANRELGAGQDGLRADDVHRTLTLALRDLVRSIYTLAPAHVPVVAVLLVVPAEGAAAQGQDE